MDKKIQHPSTAPQMEDIPAKRPYTPPSVVVHGTIAELTLAAKTAGIPDLDSTGSHVGDLL